MLLITRIIIIIMELVALLSFCQCMTAVTELQYRRIAIETSCSEVNRNVFDRPPCWLFRFGLCILTVIIEQNVSVCVLGIIATKRAIDSFSINQ